MVNSKNNYVERLINLGMNEREAKVYLALLKTPNATASDLQKNSGLRQNKIYEIIGNLVRQGYCSERQEGRIRTYESLDPQTVLKEPILTLQTRLSDSIKLQKELHDLYNAAEKNIEPFEYIEVIHGNESIHKKFVTLLNEAENEILNFVRPPFAAHSLEMYEEQNEAYNRFLDKGGKTRLVLEVNPDSHLRMYRIASVNYLEKHENEITKIADHLPLKLFIFDQKTLLYTEESATDAGNDLTMTVIRQKNTVKGYITLFDFFWKQAADCESWYKSNEQLLTEKLRKWEESENK